MGNYVLVVPGFSGQYVLPFIFSQDPQIDTGHNLSGLITISPGTFSFKVATHRFFSETPLGIVSTVLVNRFQAKMNSLKENVRNYTEKEFKSLSVPTLIFYGEYDSNGEVDSRTLRKIGGIYLFFTVRV